MIADLPEMHDADMAYDTMTGISHRRWGELLANIASLLPAGAASVVVDGPGGQPEAVADRLAATLRAAGRPCSRLASTAPAVANADCDSDSGTVVLADGPGWGGSPWPPAMAARSNRTSRSPRLRSSARPRTPDGA